MEREIYETRQVVKWPCNGSFCDLRVKSEKTGDKNNEEVTRCIQKKRSKIGDDCEDERGKC